MKKFIIGFTVGAVVSATAVYLILFFAPLVPRGSIACDVSGKCHVMPYEYLSISEVIKEGVLHK